MKVQTIKRYYIHISCIALYLLSGWGSVQAQEQPSRRALAEKLYNGYEYANAAKVLEELVDTKQPRTIDMERLANSYYYINAYSLAETWYTRVLEQPDASQEAYLHYAEVLKQQGKYAEARAQYQSYAAKYGESAAINNAIIGTDSAEVWLENPTKHKLRNEGQINTALAEFSLTPTSGGAIFIAEPQTFEGRTSGMTGQSYLRVYSASRYDDGSLNYPNMMVGSFNNSLYHVGPVAADSKEETLYITQTYPGKVAEKVKAAGQSWKEQNLELKVFRKNGEGWVEEDFAYNNVAEYSVGHAALNADNSVLYFASDMPGGMGGVDIWYCELQSDGSWGIPQNAGAAINTFGDEMFPSVYGEILYFSSTGHVGMGGLDIFKADGEKNMFKTPSNLGFPVNSASDDFAFVVFEDTDLGTKGYLSSNRTGGVGSDDIYAFNYAKPKITIQLEAITKDKTTGDFLSGVSIRIVNDKGELVSKGNTAHNGAVTLEIPRGQSLNVRGDKKGYMSENILVDAVSPKKDTLLHVTLLMQSIQRVGERFVLEDIYYDFDKHHIRPDAAVILDKLVAAMRDNPTLKVELSSHTDSRGSNAYNMSLSQRRAEAAVEYIISRGIARERLKAQGYGEKRLVNACRDGVKCTPEQHQANRRTEIEVLEY